MRTVRRAALALIALLAADTSAGAQTVWPGPRDRSVLLVEVLRPTFAGGDANLLTTAWFLTGRFAVGPRLTVHAELPLAHLSVDNSFGGGGSESVVGNVYVGGDFHSPTSPAWAEVGVRLPVGGVNAANAVGLFSDIDRYDAWVGDEVLPIKALGGYRWSYSSGAFVQVRGGPGIYLDIGDGDTEGLLHAGVWGGLDQKGFTLAAGVTGWGILTSGGNFDERTLLLGGVLGEAHFGAVRPGLTLHFPIDNDLQEVVDLVLGVRLAVALP